MTLMKFFLIFLVVAGIALGQILFKISSRGMVEEGGLLKSLTSPTLLGAFALYGGLTLFWVYLLRDIDLAKAYPVFALSFVLVPVLSWMLLGEGFNKYALYGSALIIAGVYVSFLE
ncbi:MAG: EamA family transporter [Proteobacteria bacterium]|nr:EamA family transporter [Pseudomonadota bacterium]